MSEKVKAFVDNACQEVGRLISIKRCQNKDIKSPDLMLAKPLTLLIINYLFK